MHTPFLEQIVAWTIHMIATLGYPGVFLLMTLESALIPIPSEVIMPFSGFLVSQGKFNFFVIVIIGALGNLFGSLIAYGIGYYGGDRFVRRFIKKYGMYVLISEEEFDIAVSLFHKYGQAVTAVSRVLPAVRTVISLPAGIAKLPLVRFSLLTFFGSLAWSTVLTYIGVVLGDNWESIRPLFRKFEIVIVVAFVALFVLYVYYKVRKKKK